MGTDKLWHTIRQANGQWPDPFIDVQTQTGLGGQFQGVVCATNPAGDLHVCVLGYGRNLWHTIRQANGQWPDPFIDVQAQTGLIDQRSGPFRGVACAANQVGDLHVCVTDQEGKLWHTIRQANGQWPDPFIDVQTQTGLIDQRSGLRVACAANQVGELHVCALSYVRLWHTIRRTKGWCPDPFIDVQAQTGRLGRLGDQKIASIQGVACATNQVGDLHICVTDQEGKLWHTIRQANEQWPYPFIDVQAQTGKIASIQGVACATNQVGDLHVCVIDQEGKLWHTIRQANGQWPDPFIDVQAQTGLIDQGSGQFRGVACAANQTGDLHVCIFDVLVLR